MATVRQFARDADGRHARRNHEDGWLTVLPLSDEVGVVFNCQSAQSVHQQHALLRGGILEDERPMQRLQDLKNLMMLRVTSTSVDVSSKLNANAYRVFMWRQQQHRRCGRACKRTHLHPHVHVGRNEQRN